MKTILKSELIIMFNVYFIYQLISQSILNMREIVIGAGRGRERV